MSPVEIAFRLGRSLQAKGEQLTGVLGRPAPEPTVGEAEHPPWVVCPAGVDAKPYLDRADAILDGSAELLWNHADVGFPPNWHVNPVGGQSLPLIFGKHIDYRDTARCGDVKYVWVLNRHHQTVALAQAYVLSGERRYLQGIGTLMDSWLDVNPAPMGINWTSALECAIRLINWSAAWSLVGGWQSELFDGPSGEHRRTRWLQSIYAHCRFIRRYLSRHSSANNHLIGELAGLFIATTTWPYWPEFDRHARYSRLELERELLKQTTEDGVSREQSTFYEHFVLEFVVYAGLAARAAQRPFGERFWGRIGALMGHIASITDVGGHTASFGDADDALVLPLAPNQRHTLFASMLDLGAAEFAADALRFPCRAIISPWFAAGPTPLASTVARSADFAQGGYYVLGTNLGGPDEVLIVADVGDLGYLSIAAHGHADALSFVMSVAGMPVLIDPGTYSYQADEAWRDYFRSTLAHNTVTIDQRSQAERGGKFMWSTRFSGTRDRFESGEASDLLVGRHDGYGRLADSVEHKRTWRFDKSQMELTVEDEIRCRRSHSCQTAWHFHPDVEIDLRDDVVIAKVGRATLEVVSGGAQPQLFCGSESPKLGWYAPRFGSKQASPTLVFDVQIDGTTTLQTVFRVHFDSP
jgi:hypothetical protein